MRVLCGKCGEINYVGSDETEQIKSLRSALAIALEGLERVNGLAVDHPDKSEFMRGVMSGHKDAISITSATIAKVNEVGE